MISPDKVRSEARKKENENLKFRSYLKGHAYEDELDRQFLRLHKELFADYDCSKCRNCCNVSEVRFLYACTTSLKNRGRAPNKALP